MWEPQPSLTLRERFIHCDQSCGRKSDSFLCEAKYNSIDPGFEYRGEELLQNAQCVCFIGVNPGPDGKGPISATAFFISDTMLLTAGHVAPDSKRRIIAQPPGTREARIFVEELFDDELKIPKFECEVVGTGHPNVDISILRVKGDWRPERHLSIKRKVVHQGEKIDVIGYPGNYSDRYIKKMHGGGVDRKAIDAVNQLFPKCELIVSHGEMSSPGIMPTYSLSTVNGMSGSPVIMSGEVIGRSHQRNSTDSCRCSSWALRDS